MPKHTTIVAVLQIGLLHACVFPSKVEASQYPSTGTIKRAPVVQNYQAPNVMNRSAEDAKISNENAKGLEVTGHLRGSIGYDTNMDGENPAKASAFQRYDVKLGAEYDANDTKLDIEVDFTTLDLFRRTGANQWKFLASAEGKRTFDSGQFIGFEITREHDSLDEGSATITDSAYLVMGRESDLFEFELRGGLEYEKDRGEDASDDAGNFLNDIVSSSVEGTVRLVSAATISPFLRGGFTNIRYTNPNGSTVNRNATAQFGVAGVRIQLNDRLKLDVGGRMDNRQFKAASIVDAQSAFADINLVWNPVKTLEINGKIVRYLNNPDSEDSLYSEQTAYSLGMDWEANKATTLGLLASLEQTREPDIAYESNELTLSGEITHHLSEHLGIFATFEQLWSRSQTTGDPTEAYQRTEVRTGLEFKL